MQKFVLNLFFWAIFLDIYFKKDKKSIKIAIHGITCLYIEKNISQKQLLESFSIMNLLFSLGPNSPKISKFCKILQMHQKCKNYKLHTQYIS